MTKVIGYWATTAMVAFAMLSGGAAELAKQRETVEGMVLLGYPLYFIRIIGFWKLLGGIVLLAPRFPRLKEWAYAGIFFNMTGAAVSHAVTGAAAWHVMVATSLAVLTVMSWALRPQSRTLGVLFPAKTLGLASGQGATISSRSEAHEPVDEAIKQVAS
jgi:hypothetical protein